MPLYDSEIVVGALKSRASALRVKFENRSRDEAEPGHFHHFTTSAVRGCAPKIKNHKGGSVMAKLPIQIEATLMRSAVAASADGTVKTAALEIVAKNGDQYLVILSGEGMKGLIEDMQVFLEENPEIAELKSVPRQ